MPEGTTLVVFNGQIIRAYQRELSITSKYIVPETAVMYHELQANMGDKTKLSYRLMQTSATSPAAIVSDDVAIAEAVKQHLREIDKLVE